MSDERNGSEENLTPEEIEDIESSIDIELAFFKALSGTDKVEIIPIPDEDGEIIDSDQLKAVMEECKRQNIKLLYRMRHRTHSSIFDPETKLTGVIPDNNHRGFNC